MYMYDLKQRQNNPSKLKHVTQWKWKSKQHNIHLTNIMKTHIHTLTHPQTHKLNEHDLYVQLLIDRSNDMEICSEITIWQ